MFLGVFDCAVVMPDSSSLADSLISITAKRRAVPEYALSDLVAVPTAVHLCKFEAMSALLSEYMSSNPRLMSSPAASVKELNCLSLAACSAWQHVE